MLVRCNAAAKAMERPVLHRILTSDVQSAKPVLGMEPPVIDALNAAASAVIMAYARRTGVIIRAISARLSPLFCFSGSAALLQSVSLASTSGSISAILMAHLDALIQLEGIQLGRLKIMLKRKSP